MPMVFEWTITERTGRVTVVIAPTRREAIERFAIQTGKHNDFEELTCKVERGGRV